MKEQEKQPGPEAGGVFAASWRTRQGYTLAVVGITPAKTKTGERLLRRLVPKLDRLHLSPASFSDPGLLDRELAALLQNNLPGELLAAGATLEVPGALGPAGGVLGDLHAPPSPAVAGGEKLSAGLSLAALPGGPGLVIAGNPETAFSLVSSLPTGTGGTAVLQRAASRAARRGISFLVGVTDGTGTPAKGGILAMKDFRIKTLDLEKAARHPGNDFLSFFM